MGHVRGLFFGGVFRRQALLNHLTHFVYRALLRLRNKLRVDVHRRRNARVPHLALYIFGIRSRLDQPRRIRGSQRAPVHKVDAELRAAGLMNRTSTLLSRIGFPSLID